MNESQIQRPRKDHSFKMPCKYYRVRIRGVIARPQMTPKYIRQTEIMARSFAACKFVFASLEANSMTAADWYRKILEFIIHWFILGV